MDSGSRSANPSRCINCKLHKWTLYVVGGVNSTETLKITLVYDPASNKWIEKTSMPTARHGLAAISFNNKIYVIGEGPQPGRDESNTLFYFYKSLLMKG
jgi:hypothetical protein